jgi:hypothetical protein
VKPKVSTAPLPEFFEPMQAKLVGSRPIARAWIYEIQEPAGRASTKVAFIGSTKSGKGIVARVGFAEDAGSPFD